MSAAPLLSQPASPPLPPPASSVACTHCGEAMPLGESSAGDPRFCCAGCRAVYEIVTAAGLGAYYQQREQSAARPLRGSHARKYEELDDAAFQSEHCQREGDRASVELLLEGVHCSACVWLVERVGRVVPGVLSARLDLSRNVVALSYNAAAVQLSAVARALESLGYPVHALSASTSATAKAQDRQLLLRLGVAGAAAGNVMLLSLALYSGAFTGMDAEFQTLFRWAGLVIATPTVFWAGALFLRGGWAALRTRTPHMDLPVSVGILVGFTGGAINTLTGRGEIYFDTLCTLIFLLLVGRYLQQNHHRRSTDQSELLLALAPRTARLVDGEAERTVPANGVAALSVVRVAAGERVPVDGVVSRGAASLDTSLLTGEPLPVEVGVADRVYAGTTCQSGELWLRVESAGAATRLGRLMASVEVTQRERAPIVRLADRVSGYFVSGILLVAALVLVIWLFVDPRHAVDHTVALLVVTCPCALGMATPLAVSMALRRAAACGVLFKGGEFIEELARPGVMIFDKTGTLTEGRPELVSWFGDAALKAAVRAAESQSVHPLARSIQRAFPENQLLVEELRELPQGGISAIVEGAPLLIGSARLVESKLGRLPSWAEALVTRHASAGRTPVVIASRGAVSAVAAFGDTLRPEARANLEQLAGLGFRFEILSGDHPSVIASIARELGVPSAHALGGQSPEAKLRHVSELRQKGERVFMVGDGVNDVAAMAAATVGIAVHGGAETCLRAADVFATRAGLGPVTTAAVGARRTLRAIRYGVALSLSYNLVGIGLAISGNLSPLLAAIMMPLSSLSVVSLALRARTFE